MPIAPSAKDNRYLIVRDRHATDTPRHEDLSSTAFDRHMLNDFYYRYSGFEIFNTGTVDAGKNVRLTVAVPSRPNITMTPTPR